MRAIRASLVVAGVFALASLAGCASVIALDDLHKESGAGSTSGSGADGGSSPAASSAPSSPSSPSPSGPGAGGASNAPAGDPTCGALPGPPMARVTKDGDSFCIDTTHVTIDQYASFAAASHGGPSFPSQCAQHGPPRATPPPAGAGGDAVTQITWCDAVAYCAWAGKSLCGRTSGGSLDTGGGNGGNDKSAWVAACGAGVLASSGQIADWEDGCTGNDPEDSCTARGAACDAASSLDRTATAPDVGIRCCSP